MTKVDSLGNCTLCGRYVDSTSSVCECEYLPKPQRKTPHKCPCCAGTGLVSFPPGVAGDQEWSTAGDMGPWECQACKGTCVVWEPGQ